MLDLLAYGMYRLRFPNASIGMGSRVDRSTSLGEGVRIEKRCSITRSVLRAHVLIGNDCRISSSVIEHHSRMYRDCGLWEVQLGAYSYIATRSELSRTKVGRFCSLGARLQCTIGTHPVQFVSTSPLFYSTLKQCGVTFTDRDYIDERIGIHIGNEVWIGNSVFIKDGIRIGNGAIVAGGAAVVDDVPDYAIVGGVPARLIRYRFPEEVIRELLDICWWSWSEDKLRKAQPRFAQEDVWAFIEWAREHPN